MQGQGYDGASIMSGHVGGVQTRIRAILARAQYVHCRLNVPNFCTIHSSKGRIVRAQRSYQRKGASVV